MTDHKSKPTPSEAIVADGVREQLEKIEGMDLLALAAGLEDNLCHKHCACPRDKTLKDCIQERAANVLRALPAPEPQRGTGE